MEKASSTIADRFSVCFPFTLAQEDVDPARWSDPKNFSDTPGDPGGATMNGIIQSEYNAWRRAHGLAIQGVKVISREEGYAIYRGNYWLPYCPHLPEGLDLQFFDAAVNQGVHEAIEILQVALGIAKDGVWGPLTAAAVAGIKDVTTVGHAFTARREAVYRQTGGFKEFGTDWTRRALQIGAEALKMETA